MNIIALIGAISYKDYQDKNIDLQDIEDSTFIWIALEGALL